MDEILRRKTKTSCGAHRLARNSRPRKNDRGGQDLGRSQGRHCADWRQRRLVNIFKLDI